MYFVKSPLGWLVYPVGEVLHTGFGAERQLKPSEFGATNWYTSWANFKCSAERTAKMRRVLH